MMMSVTLVMLVKLMMIIVICGDEDDVDDEVDDVDDVDDDLLNLNLLICPHTHGSSTPLPSLMLITASRPPTH